MRALHFDGAELRCIDDHPEPSPGTDEAVVRVHLAGVCSTDLQILAGYMGFTGVPGHEFVGEVVDGPTDIADQRVVGEINYACRRCPTCRRGLGRHCPHRRVMGILGADGAFAEYLAVPLTNLHVVPDAVPDEAAVFTEPLAAAFSILEQVTLGPGDGVVVLGDGKLGLLCAQVLAGTGASVTLVGKHVKNLVFVADRGVATVLLEAWTPAAAADCVVEATGSATGLALAVAAVRPRGTLVLKSTVADEHRLSLAPLVINEITVIGSRCGLFPPALRALADRSVDVTPLIDAKFPLAGGVDALAHAARPGIGKVLISP
jgi:threonine dehydrogenase-like Zn-dependent dehydrogenase